MNSIIYIIHAVEDKDFVNTYFLRNTGVLISS